MKSDFLDFEKLTSLYSRKASFIVNTSLNITSGLILSKKEKKGNSRESFSKISSCRVVVVKYINISKSTASNQWVVPDLPAVDVRQWSSNSSGRNCLQVSLLKTLDLFWGLCHVFCTTNRTDPRLQRKQAITSQLQHKITSIFCLANYVEICKSALQSL